MIIFILTILLAVIAQGNTASQITSYASVSKTEIETEGVEVVQFEIRSLYNGQLINIRNIPREVEAFTLQNETDVRFVATILNEAEVNIKLKKLEIVSYNSSTTEFEERIYQKEYSLEALEQLVLEPHQLKTETLDEVILFNDFESVYKIHCRFFYDAIGLENGTDRLARFENNISISVILPPSPPLDIIIWGMIFSLGTVIFVFAVGFIGQRRKEILEKRKK
jgi:hypothetical protein